MRMRPPELMQIPRAPGWVVGLSSGTRLKPSQVPSTRPQRLSLMLAPPPVRLTCTIAGISMRCRTGSLALQVPLLLVSWQTIQPQSQSRLPVALVRWFGEPYGLGDGTVALVALGAFLGHLYPVFFRFQGGKGVATALGVLVGIDWLLGLATAATWLIIAFFFRYSSLASLAAALFAPVYYLMAGGVAWSMDKRILAAISVMAMLLFWRHRENIQRLIEGKESRLGSKKKPEAPATSAKPRKK